MLAAARLTSLARTIMPYATWVACVINLGYVGYNLYELYRVYVAQVGRDLNSGTTRSFDDTIELVVKSRRRRTQLRSDDSTQNLPQPSSSTEENHLVRECPTLPTQDGMNCENTWNKHFRTEYPHQDPISIECHDGDSTTASTSLESTDSNRGVVADIYSDCFICATPLDDSQKAIVTLPFCMHPFHKNCLDGVVKWHKKCPVCNYSIICPI